MKLSPWDLLSYFFRISTIGAFNRVVRPAGPCENSICRSEMLPYWERSCVNIDCFSCSSIGADLLSRGARVRLPIGSSRMFGQLRLPGTVTCRPSSQRNQLVDVLVRPDLHVEVAFDDLVGQQVATG
jgi:hypothetical protein